MQLLLLIAFVCGATSSPGQLACIDRAAGSGGAVVLVDTGSGATTMIGPGQADGAPRWSPEGAWLAFETTPEPAKRAICVAAADGTGRQIVASGPGWCTAPAWSTDGTRLVYCRANERGGAAQFAVLDLNTGEVQIWGGGRPGLLAPHWLPYTLLLKALDPDLKLEVPGVDMARFVAEARMGAKELETRSLPEALLGIAVSPRPEGKRAQVSIDLVLVTKSEVLPIMPLTDRAGSGPNALPWGFTSDWNGVKIERKTPDEGMLFGAYVFKSPGATERFAYETNEGGDREIYVLGKRGIANVTNHRSADWNPVWSPDGKVLAFESFRGGQRGVYTVYTDTAHVVPVAAGPDRSCWSPAWSPDGTQIAYVSDENGTPQIYAVDLRGNVHSPMTTGGGPKEAPAWRPDSN